MADVFKMLCSVFVFFASRTRGCGVASTAECRLPAASVRFEHLLFARAEVSWVSVRSVEHVLTGVISPHQSEERRRVTWWSRCGHDLL